MSLNFSDLDLKVKFSENPASTITWEQGDEGFWNWYHRFIYREAKYCLFMGGFKYATTLQYAITASLLFMKYIFGLLILTSGCKCSFSVFFVLFCFFHFTFFVSLISSVMSIYIDSLYVGFKGLINVHIWRLE